MRRRIRKAIKAAWRLPETLYSTKVVVLLSRCIVLLAVLVVPSTAAFSLFLFLPYIYALAITSVTFAACVLAVTWIFSSEYFNIKRFESLESKVQKHFYRFAGLSDILLVEEDTNLWLAYGHVPEAKFKGDICKIVAGISGGALSAEACVDSLTKVEYKYATLDKKGQETSILFCEMGERHSFPVSMLDIRGIVT